MTSAADAGQLGQLKAAARDSSSDTSWRISPYALKSAAASLAAGTLPAIDSACALAIQISPVHYALEGSLTFIASPLHQKQP